MKTLTTLVATALLILAFPGWANGHGASPLVEPEWLKGQLERDDLVVLDVRNALDGGGHDTYLESHIPGALHSDYLEAGWRTERNGVPAQLPAVESLEALIRELGISNDDHVVITSAGTDGLDFGSATRIYWTFKVLGHDRVSILNGGFRGWQAAGLPVASGGHERPTSDFQAAFRPEMVGTTEALVTWQDRGAQLVDNRPREQFLGHAGHPAARAYGTIPEAKNVEEARLIIDESGRAVDSGQLQQLLAEAGVDPDREIVTFCNTGHWASVGWFALSEIAGHNDVLMYDGSMVEWSASPERPLQVERQGLARLVDRLFN